jgi:hypothetical protein
MQYPAKLNGSQLFIQMKNGNTENLFRIEGKDGLYFTNHQTDSLQKVRNGRTIYNGLNQKQTYRNFEWS